MTYIITCSVVFAPTQKRTANFPNFVLLMEEFERYLRAHTKLSDDEIAQVCAVAIPCTLRRNEALLQQGQICRQKVFVLNGLLRTYGTATDGTEYILQFSPEDTWTLDVESYDNLTPAKHSIEAVEATSVLLWNRTDFDRVLSAIPGMKELSQTLISRNIYNSRHRLSTTLSASPEEKYEAFLQAYPGLLQRLPLRMIAAYIGVSIKTLTRIRHAQVRR